jgi:hypothetical protein
LRILFIIGFHSSKLSLRFRDHFSRHSDLFSNSLHHGSYCGRYHELSFSVKFVISEILLSGILVCSAWCGPVILFVPFRTAVYLRGSAACVCALAVQLFD